MSAASTFAMKTSLVLVAALAASLDAHAGDRLIPAGSINSVLAYSPLAVVIEDHPAVRAQARGIRDQFFRGAEILTGEEALDRELSGFNLIVYGTPDGNAWLRAHAASLPFAFDGAGLTLQEERYEGEHLRAICAVRNPENPERRAVVYVARRAEDISGINNVFHGPTEWLVADGRSTLAQGDWVVTGPVSVAAMERDLEYVVACIQDVHPAAVEGLPRAVRAAVERARAEIAEPLSREELWHVLNRVLVSLRDAHTSLARKSSAEGVDLPVRWLQDGIVVRANTDVLLRGDRVLRIGGRSEEELLVALSEIVPAETPLWVRRVAERVLPDAALLRSLELLDDEGLSIVVERGGQEVEVLLPLGTPPRPEERLAWVRYSIDEEASLGVFTLDACRNDETYRSRLRAFFEAVHEKGIERIAVDVRANGGGNSSVVDEFLRYLDVDEYRSYSGDVRVSEESVAQRGSDGLDHGYHELRNAPRVNPRVEDLPAFAGELFVLTSPGTFSSGNWFAVIFHDNALGEVLGEPTGNAPSCYGDVLTLTLPETAFTATMSYKKWLRPDPELDPVASLEPNRWIPLTREDLIAGRDPVLEYLRDSTD